MQMVLTTYEVLTKMHDQAYGFRMSQREALPVSASEMKRRTARDLVMSQVYEATVYMYIWLA